MNNLSVIDPKAKIGKDVKVDAFVTIYGDVEIGEGTWIGPNVTIFDGARIGKNCKIFPGAVISAVPQDLKYEGENTTTIIGDNTTLREYVTINRGTKAAGKTVVGSNCLIMAYVHVAHDCVVGNNVILANGVTLAGHITIHDFAIIGGLSAVHQFVEIGGHVMISGGSLVRKDVPPFTKAAREPLTYNGINSIGLKRRGYSDDKIREIQNIYRLVYLQGHSTTKAINMVEEQFPDTDEKNEIVNFIKASSRGIIKGVTLSES
jgi:UDP-N-acetylglucosamine acyltransferase